MSNRPDLLKLLGYRQISVGLTDHWTDDHDRTVFELMERIDDL